MLNNASFTEKTLISLFCSQANKKKVRFERFKEVIRRSLYNFLIV